MGTRHLQRVISKAGEVKISQYGQWDGYPSGQGIGILEYLRSGNLDKYHNNLINIPMITEEQCSMVNEDINWKENYPYLSRDCGSDIHQMVEDGTVKFVALMENQEANKWCEGFYTIDLSSNLFISEYYGTKTQWPLDKLPTNEEYLKQFENED